MHSAAELSADSFGVEVDGVPARVDDVLPGFDAVDRLGVVIRGPADALGASVLIALTMTRFYDRQRELHGGDYWGYPDFFVIGAGCRPLDYAMLDVWPEHKWVEVDASAEAVWRAVNDRAVTRLALVDTAPLGGALERQTRASAVERLRSAWRFGPAGSTPDADLRLVGDPAVERYVDRVLDDNEARLGPDRTTRLRRARPSLGSEPRRATETYRRLTVDEALRAV